MKNYKIIVSYVLFAIWIIYCVFTTNINKENIFLLTIVIVGFVKVLGFFILPLSKYVDLDKNNMYLSLYFGGSGFLTLLTVWYIMIGTQRSYSEIAIITLFTNVLEIIALFKVIKSRYKDNKTIVSNLFFYMSIFLCLSVVILIVTKKNLSPSFIFWYGLGIKIINISISTLCLCYFQKYIFNRYEERIEKYLGIYLITKLTYNSLALVGNEVTQLLYLKVIFLLLGAYSIGRIFLLFIIKNPSETLNQSLIEKNRALEKAVEELKRYSKLIEEDNEHINNMLNAFPEGVGIFENGKMVFANTKCKELFKCDDSTDLIGCYRWELVREDYRELLKSRDSKLEKENHCDEAEFVFKFKDSEFLGEAVSSKIKRGDREFVIGIIRDITNKKIIESLSEKIECNERENKLRSESLTNLSHEFKTPVNVIYSAIQMQDVYYSKGDMENIMKFNFVMRQNCFRLLRLINNFIDTSKFESKIEIKSKMRVLNIVSLVEDVVTSVVSYGNKNNISIVFDTENEEIYGNFDSEMMDRIMLNLLSNSIKYNVDGGNILVEIRETLKEVIIHVKDTGVGIAEEDLKKLFSRFERLDMSLSRKREGSGIGLNIVKSLVEYQKGVIDIDSKVGVGTTFSLIFPKVESKYVDNEYYSRENEDLQSKVNLEMSDII